MAVIIVVAAPIATPVIVSDDGGHFAVSLDHQASSYRLPEMSMENPVLRLANMPVVACLLAPSLQDNDIAQHFNTSPQQLQAFFLEDGFTELLDHYELANHFLGSDHSELRCGSLSVNLLTRVARQNAGSVILAPREFSLLAYFMQNLDRKIGRRELLQAVWNYSFDPETNVLEVHISKLRSKIAFARNGLAMETIKGCGYRLRCT